MIDFGTMFQSLLSNFTVVNAVLFLLLVVSEILGTNESIKSSSIFGVIKAMLGTIIGQIWPQKPTDVK